MRKSVIKTVTKTTAATVKIMLSYDYCHFEVSKSMEGDITDESINTMRKDVQRLADEAVRQYKVAKVLSEAIASRNNMKTHKMLETRVGEISMKPESERTPTEKAFLKVSNDSLFQEDRRWDYDDEDPF